MTKPILSNFFVQLFLVILIAYFSVVIIRIAVQRFFAKTDFLSERREKTLESMIVSIAQYAASIGIIIFALSHFVEIGKLLAGAGVIGIIVGFGAQSLIKDILSGVTLLYEKQLHKGDFITVNNEYSGTVEEIGLRLLKIRQWSGKLLTIRNGEVSEILNFNMHKMRVIEKVAISFQENPAKVMNVLEGACNELNAKHTNFLLKTPTGEIIEKFQVYGMTSVNATFRGYEYTVIGLVEDKIYFTAAKNVRLTIAQHLYNEGIQMAEENVRLLSRTMNTKETAYEKS
ncbi:mechanosensitive ion channel protein MscS [Lottiidibacillus patelloidae]|uniref:Mechanosensitive ion channel protein MscS n=2 Tax=Lottiidibacillus patelloidae TaxID=2670334 RepID=A0A263BUU3_9BACI|nr:mechanosensitive ion channel protein MscS [Lottiidibacillus patelloidae]